MKLFGRTVFIADGNVEKALRKFKKKVQDSGLMLELRERESYEKPTTARKRRRAAAVNRWHKELARQKLPPKLY
jgi:small subunit ribosomal protein S21